MTRQSRRCRVREPFPEARQRAREIAAAAPPFSAAIRDQIRLILWGSLAPVPRKQTCPPRTRTPPNQLARCATPRIARQTEGQCMR